MNSLVRELIQPILEELSQTVALYPGKFKPPHRGHFEVAKRLLDKADRVIVLISGSPKDNITAQQSKQIWNLYNELLDNRLELQIVDGSPVKYVLDAVKENPNNKYIAAFGKGESERFKYIADKPNVEIADIGAIENLAATNFRKALQTGEDISKFLPQGIDKQQVLDILTKIEEMSQVAIQSVEDFADRELDPLDIEFTGHFFDRLVDPRNIKPISSAELIGFFKRLSKKKKQLIDFLSKYKEIVATDNRTDINIPLIKQANTAIAKTIMRKKDFKTPDPKIEFNETISENINHEFKDALISLVQYMIEQDMNILPLPTLKIIDNDVENANNILGKTAYYNPNECSITLYTLNRHPKDILRSFSHEMIHRIQDNEGRLNNIGTTNTNEEGDLPELEKEAYLKGNMCFRNWEDSIKNEI
jgi:cytidyltransferase-like protein